MVDDAALAGELQSLNGDAAAQQTALDSLLRKAMVMVNRQALTAAGATKTISEFLSKGVDPSGEGKGGLEPRVASAAMDLLAVLCCDDQSREEAVEAGAIAAIVSVVAVVEQVTVNPAPDNPNPQP